MAKNDLGLTGKVQSLHESLNAHRLAGNDLSLRDGLKKGVKLKDGTVIRCESVEKLLEDLGIDPKKDSISAVVALPEDQRWIVPEIFLDILDQGMRQENAFYQAIIQSSISRNTLTFQQPEISPHNVEDHGLKGGGIGTTPEEGTQAIFSVRDIKTEKFERKISIPHEVMKYSSIDHLAVFMRKMAKAWGLQLTRRAINVAINGDQTSGALAAGVIGVEDNTNGIQWVDLTRIHARMMRLGYSPTTVISAEEELIHVVNLDEFKDVRSGNVIGKAKLQGKLPNEWDFYIHSVIPAGQYIFLDPNFTMQELVSEGMRVESQRLMDRDLSETYVRIQQGFANIFRDARVIVNASLNYSANQFPAFMAPID